MKLRVYVLSERRLFWKDKGSYLKKYLLKEHEYTIWRYIKLLRKEEFYLSKRNLILSAYYRRQKNRLGERIGFTIPANVFGAGLNIWHYGNIVVNANAKIGVNCTLHGDNCIGNNGYSEDAPVLGNNVDIGVGAKIIGGVYIADNVTIGAGAIVNKSFDKPNVVIAGIPAKIIKEK